MIHVADWRAGLEWYRRAFPSAVNVREQDFGHVRYQGVSIEIVTADEKVASGAAGSVVYWHAENFDAQRQYLISLGARSYRGPLAIGGPAMMCQLLDPWGNCIGLRGDL
jgi:predicted enzyme related to lactoylglutathione lyase